MLLSSTRNPTLRDLYNGLKADGSFDREIVELVCEANQDLLSDAVVIEANGTENDRTTIRTGLPDATWTAYYEGTQPSKGSKKQVSNSIGTLKSLIQVDADLIADSPNGAEEMLDEAFSHAEAMGQEVCDAIFYGNIKVNAKKFNGLAPVYNAYGGTDSQQSSYYCIQSSARSSTPNNSALRSIFLVGWGRRGAYLPYPRGSKGGLDRGPVEDATITLTDGVSRLKVKEQFFKWRVGLTVKDFRCCGRVCNIESNNLASLDKDIGEDMLKLKTRCRLNGLKPAFYMPESVYEWLVVKTRRQVLATSFSFKDVGGQQVLHFDSIPIRKIDCLEINEAVVPAVS
ncbi:MAG TPA: phage major capsid protein [Kiritimatiellia bacterium]|nr:phage major capsid protein [Kiritimatiellia bacterium]HRU71390.1 phage major capsid protein [Kiritimatiellia bacterium]